MNTDSLEFSAFEAITGMIVSVSFIVLGFLLTFLRSHVDEEKIRKEKCVAAVFRSFIPPERVLTDTGRRRVRSAKIALGIWVVTLAVIVVRVYILAP